MNDPGLVVGGWLGRLMIAVYARTCRVSIVQGADDFEAARTRSGPVLVGIWHEHLPLLVPFLLYRLHLDGRPMTYLVSRSRDGELAVRMMRCWGVMAVRGSSSSGASQAVREVYRAMENDGLSPLIVVDGPRGPARQAKPGLAALGRLTGAPTLLMAAAARPARRLRSWDRMVVPWPLARVWVAVESVPESARASANAEEPSVALQQRLEALRTRAEAEAGG